jgi:hypothetical protein
VIGEDLPLLSEEKAPAIEAEKAEVAEIAEVAEEELPLLQWEEIPPVKEAVEISTPTSVPAQEILSERVTGEIADRIVREVSDRLISRIEKIIWEVVPDLAEVLITKEIEKIKAAAEEQETP